MAILCFMFDVSAERMTSIDMGFLIDSNGEIITCASRTVHVHILVDCFGSFVTDRSQLLKSARGSPVHYYATPVINLQPLAPSPHVLGALREFSTTTLFLGNPETWETKLATQKAPTPPRVEARNGVRSWSKNGKSSENRVDGARHVVAGPLWEQSLQHLFVVVFVT